MYERAVVVVVVVVVEVVPVSAQWRLSDTSADK